MADVPVLMVHGFASSFERNWREPGWVDVLEDEGHRVFGVDILGHGDAPKPTEPEAYRDLDLGVENALPESGQVDAVGFSMGGQLLLRVASRVPGRFRRIALGGVGDNVFGGSTAEAAAVAIEEGRAIGPDDEGVEGHEALGAFARFAQAPGNDPAALAACMRRPEQRLTEEDLARVTVPVLVVLGDRDFAGPAERLVAALPEARLVTLAGADHFGTPKDFRFIEAVVDFLR
ncbi:MAG: alpha/beta fold hydrolase [Acidobacteriota bacterium]|nr:alpha/beta fold hydrolase [Acidobacteriota bacterium]